MTGNGPVPVGGRCTSRTCSGSGPYATALSAGGAGVVTATGTATAGGAGVVTATGTATAAPAPGGMVSAEPPSVPPGTAHPAATTVNTRPSTATIVNERFDLVLVALLVCSMGWSVRRPNRCVCVS